MNLSRLVLNLRSREVGRDLADCQQMHRTILNLFPRATGAPRPGFALLFRIEYPPVGNPFVLIQSREAPDLDHLPAGYLACAPESKDISEAIAAVRAAMTLRFRLRANPTRKIDTRSAADGSRRNGRRVELRTDEDRLAWLARKSAAAGFRLVAASCSAEVLNVRLAPQGRLFGSRTGADGHRRRLTFGSVLFEGMLEVVDPVQFRTTMETGIGSAKAYGFGLLSVAPPLA